LGLIGCSAVPGGPSGVEAAVVASDKARERAPDAEIDDVRALAAGNTAFALDLYRQLLEEAGDENLFYSPYSLSVALAMTYAGAEGETAEQMAEALHLALPEPQLHAAFNRLDLLLASRGEGAEGKDDQGFRLNVVNALWGQRDYEFLAGFLDTLAENYGAGLRTLDFASDPEGARKTINAWVEDQTEGRIEDLIPAGVLTALTRLVLTNAIYFNAAWAEPFNEARTEDDSFTLLDGSEVSVPMMHQTTNYAYAEGEGYRAVELPYDGNELSMLIVLPEVGTLGDYEAGLDAADLNDIVDRLQHRSVTLAMPRFETRSAFSVVEALQALGMEDAFSQQDADFSGMTEKPELYVSEVVHEAFVSVDEAGTEAAAATAVVMTLRSAAPMDPVEMRIDHPFLFFIRDVETGTVLFVGRIVDPRG
jgi:serpin B